jgi:uncharacterized protein YndB with AHSA1/START domain
MSKYVGVVTTTRPPAEVFAYLADASNFATWDPGVLESTSVDQTPPGPGSAFDVTVSGPRPTTLRYRIIEFDPPETVVLEARSELLWSLDRITVTATKSGSIVAYEAELELTGALRFLNPLLGPVFQRIGNRAARGLELALRSGAPTVGE